MDETKRLVNGAWDGAVARHGAISSGMLAGGNGLRNGSSKAPPMFTVEGNGVSSHAEVRAGGLHHIANPTANKLLLLQGKFLLSVPCRVESPFDIPTGLSVA